MSNDEQQTHSQYRLPEDKGGSMPSELDPNLSIDRHSFVISLSRRRSELRCSRLSAIVLYSVFVVRDGVTLQAVVL